MGIKLSDKHVGDPVWWVVCKRCGWKTDEPNTAVSFCLECVHYGMPKWDARMTIVSGKTQREVEQKIVILSKEYL